MSAAGRPSRGLRVFQGGAASQQRDGQDESRDAEPSSDGGEFHQLAHLVTAAKKPADSSDSNAALNRAGVPTLFSTDIPVIVLPLKRHPVVANETVRLNTALPDARGRIVPENVQVVDTP
jgi:hypothetical protein